MHPDRAQAGAFLPGLLEKAGLLETDKAADHQDEEILKLNVIVVYKKLVQGLVYSPPDCDKYLALDAKPQVSVALPATLASTVWQCCRGWHRRHTRLLHASGLACNYIFFTVAGLTRLFSYFPLTHTGRPARLRAHADGEATLHGPRP